MLTKARNLNQMVGPWKDAVHLATAGAIADLAAVTEDIDGVANVDVPNNFRVLVKDQADNTLNGIYIVTAQEGLGTFVLERSEDCQDDVLDLTTGMMVYVRSGEALSGLTNGGKTFVFMSQNQAEFGTSPIIWAEYISGATPQFAREDRGSSTSSEWVLAETPSGAFPIQVFKNGQLLIEGSLVDYEISGAVVTFNTAILITDRVSAQYSF